MEQVYIKKGKRYIPIGVHCERDYLTKGLWLVCEDNHCKSIRNVLYRVADADKIDLCTYAKLLASEDKICKRVLELERNGKSISDFVREIFLIMSEEVRKTYLVMFTQKCFIRKNTPEIREQLERLGYEICSCCLFDKAVWLASLPDNGSIHGVGYWDETFPPDWNEEKELSFFLYEANNSDIIDCEDNNELFLALSAMRDDTDKNQWFIDEYDNWFVCGFDCIMEYYTAFPLDGTTPRAKKATVEQIIAHFKNK